MNDCKKLIQLADELAPSKYHIQLLRDEGLTGRFEVTLYKTEADMVSEINGTVIHSKEKTGKWPWDDEKFTENIKSY